LFPDEITKNKEENKKEVLEHLVFWKIGYSLGNYNINTGLDLVFFYPENFWGDGVWEDSLFPKHIIGVNYKYQFAEKDSIVRLDYAFLLPFPIISINFGLGGSYNINKQEFGFVPKIGFKVLLLFDIDYRYNIMIDNMGYLTNKNSHEIVVSFSVPSLLFSYFFHELF
jgi:hypothetical protein